MISLENMMKEVIPGLILMISKAIMMMMMLMMQTIVMILMVLKRLTLDKYLLLKTLYMNPFLRSYLKLQMSIMDNLHGYIL